MSNMNQATLKKDVWALVKHAGIEAFLELSSKKKLDKYYFVQCIQMMDFRCIKLYRFRFCFLLCMASTQDSENEFMYTI